jgi:hypothetical protein
MRTTLAICLATFAIALASPALAQDDEAADATVTSDASAARMTLPEQQLYIQAFLPMNLSTDAAFKPVSFAPDIWFGVNSDLTVGLTHSRHAADGFFGGPSAGLCFQAEEDGCIDPVNGTGLQGRYQIPVDKVPVPLAAEAGLFVGGLDPFALALKLGVVGRKDLNKLTALFGLNLFFGLTSRTIDDGMGTEVTTNGETINLPITVMYAVTPELSLGGQTGAVLPLQNTADTYAIPLAVGGRYMVSSKIHADLIFSLPALVTGAEVSGFDVRVLTLGGGYIF